MYTWTKQQLCLVYMDQLNFMRGLIKKGRLIERGQGTNEVFYPHCGEGGGGGQRRKAAVFFDDTAMPGNGANNMSISPLLRMTSTKTLFS